MQYYGDEEDAESARQVQLAETGILIQYALRSTNMAVETFHF